MYMSHCFSTSVIQIHVAQQLIGSTWVIWGDCFAAVCRFDSHGWELSQAVSCQELIAAQVLTDGPVYCAWHGVVCCTSELVAAGACVAPHAIHALKLGNNRLNGDLADDDFIQSLQHLHECGLRHLDLEANELWGPLTDELITAVPDLQYLNLGKGGGACLASLYNSMLQYKDHDLFDWQVATALLNLHGVFSGDLHTTSSKYSAETRGLVATHSASCVVFHYTNISKVVGNRSTCLETCCCCAANNWVEESIPSAVEHFKQMRYFNLANNGLTGTIPSSFGNLAQLQVSKMISMHAL